MKTRLKLFIQTAIASLRSIDVKKILAALAKACAGAKAFLMRFDLKKVLASLRGFGKEAISFLRHFLELFGAAVYETRELIDAAIGLAGIVAFILILRGCHGCSHGTTTTHQTPPLSPQDTAAFVSTQQTPTTEGNLRKKGAKVPVEVKSGNIANVVQIKLKTGGTLQVIVAHSPASKGGLDIYVPKDSMIASVEVLDIEQPWIKLESKFGAGITTDLSLHFSPSVSLSLLQIGKYRFPVLAADLQGIGAGIGYEILPDIEIAAAYFYQFNGSRALKLGAYYEF
jgi:hypothetical protein